MNEIKNSKGLTEKEFLKQYKPGDYQRPSVTVDMLLFTLDDIEVSIRKNKKKEMKILLIKRKDHPYIDSWAIPGGFVDINEDIETAAYRELKEETNIDENVYLEQLYTFGAPDRDPRMRVISTAYIALTPNENIKKTIAGDDAVDAKWFTVKLNEVDESTSILNLYNKENNILISYGCYYTSKKLEIKHLSGHKLAFDHYKSIELAIRRLRGKIFYTDIAFSLLPEKFTLTEAQNVYEVILGKTLDKSNFRKKILPLVEATNEEYTIAAHRPAKLYKLKEDNKREF